MICEPNFDLPQKFDIKQLQNAAQIDSNTTENAPADWLLQHVKPKISYLQKDFNILPKFYDQFEHLNRVLSVKENQYLNCRWNQFLNNAPREYVKIRLFQDFQKEKEHFVVKRKTLNGQFYGVDNKLAPIPQLDDPRK
ncbi:uncharacterized protein LOC101888484 [Musca domestica]|uniref:Uncharacterized protein LOC101888484 n=1 Tax=Musca domestica TaxID=7370 RepID=A0ABM3URD8_MUSDO|nr:uncharacterized protein LOC101888484 [Musca domestica]